MSATSTQNTDDRQRFKLQLQTVTAGLTNAKRRTKTLASKYREAQQQTETLTNELEQLKRRLEAPAAAAAAAAAKYSINSNFNGQQLELKYSTPEYSSPVAYHPSVPSVSVPDPAYRPVTSVHPPSNLQYQLECQQVLKEIVRPSAAELSVPLEMAKTLIKAQPDRAGRLHVVRVHLAAVAIKVPLAMFNV
jgi:hypothetical protein